MIDIGTSWMFDLKEGVCMDAFWLNREQCCWVANDTTFDQEGCAQVGRFTGILYPRTIFRKKEKYFQLTCSNFNEQLATQIVIRYVMNHTKLAPHT